MKEDRDRKDLGDSWVPERNIVTSFTFKGMGKFLLLVGLVAIIKYFFFSWGVILWE